MAKKYALLFLSIALLVVVVNFSVTGASDAVVLCSNESGVVDKAAGGAFTAKIVFKNVGKTQGNWSVNVVFEGEAWVWKGTPQNLILNPGATKTLVWNGVVPTNATLNSVARLVVYYEDSFKALDWWIRVVPGAELTIQYSAVE
jgi:hypothetical protein